MMFSLTTGLSLGLLLGMRHALEPDHLAAVSVLITRRGSPRAGAVLGAFWGVGHTLALFGVGCILAALGSRLPPGLADGFELLVAAMLLVLGGRAIVRFHGATGVAARGGHGPTHGSWALGRQPLLVGLIHGLAGSGALTALVLASLPTVTTRLLYIVFFGVGSIVGMTFLTGVAGWPLSRMGEKGRASRWLSVAAGAVSVLLGVSWGFAALRGLLQA